MKNLLNHNLTRRNGAGMRGQLKGFKLGTHFPKQHLVAKRMFGRGGFRGSDIVMGKKLRGNKPSIKGDHGIEPSTEELNNLLSKSSSGVYGSSVKKKKGLRFGRRMM